MNRSEIIEIEDLQELSPRKIKAELDKVVIGQEDAKRTMSVIGYNAAIRYLNYLSGADIPIAKSNAIVVGPTGCGKTLLMETLSEVIRLPVLIADGSSITKTGYVGSSATDLVHSLVDKATMTVLSYSSDQKQISTNAVHKARFGIIYIDEVDKLRSQGYTNGDVGNTSVQEELLRLIEGTMVDSKTGQFSITRFDTRDVSFVVGGAFVGIEDVIKARLNLKGMGFHSSAKRQAESNTSVLSKLTQDDLIKFGMLPEFIGRFNRMTTLNKLSINELQSAILYSEKSVLAQYKTYFGLHNKRLKINGDALELLATTAFNMNSGARALNLILTKVLFKHEFKLCTGDSEKEEIIITLEDVRSVL